MEEIPLQAMFIIGLQGVFFAFFTVHLRKTAAYVKSISKNGAMPYSQIRNRKHEKITEGNRHPCNRDAGKSSS